MSLADAPPRAFAGLADLTFAPRDGRTRLVHSLTRAPLTVGRALYHDEALPDLAHLILANPTAGIFAGDRMAIRVRVRAGGRAHLTTQAATRVHAMPTGAATQTIRLVVAAGAALEWLPDPLIPFRGARFTQATTLLVAPGGTLIYGDILSPGRVASGESFAYRRLTSRLTVSRPVGPPLYGEAFSLLPGTRSPLGRALLGPASAVLGTLLIVTEAIPPPLLRDQLRAALSAPTTPAPGDAARAAVEVLPGGGGVCLKVLGAAVAPVAAVLRCGWGVARRAIWDADLPSLRKY